MLSGRLGQMALKGPSKYKILYFSDLILIIQFHDFDYHEIKLCRLRFPVKIKKIMAAWI